MGPRNRRRLTTGGIVVGVIAAAAAAVVLLIHWADNSGPALSSGTARVPVPTFVTDTLVYGMSKAEVLRRAGQATKTVGACWQYNENEKIRGGANTLNAQRVCFLSGLYSYDYSEIDGKWIDRTTPLKVPPDIGS
jgi:hypothetical protein